MIQGSLRENLTGMTFSKLTVLDMYQIRTNNNRWAWMCKCVCECGDTVDVLAASIKRGATRTCGKHQKYWANSGEKNKGYTGYKSISGKLWSTIQRRAANREIAFDLTIEYAWSVFEEQKGKCALSGIDLFFGKNSEDRAGTTASIDRIDVNQGYVTGNIQWVHKKVNIMRNVYSIEEYIDICRKVANHADRVRDR
jgi:hypothetical protein